MKAGILVLRNTKGKNDFRVTGLLIVPKFIIRTEFYVFVIPKQLILIVIKIGNAFF